MIVWWVLALVLFVILYDDIRESIVSPPKSGPRFYWSALGIGYSFGLIVVVVLHFSFGFQLHVVNSLLWIISFIDGWFLADRGFKWFESKGDERT